MVFLAAFLSSCAEEQIIIDYEPTYTYTKFTYYINDQPFELEEHQTPTFYKRNKTCQNDSYYFSHIHPIDKTHLFINISIPQDQINFSIQRESDILSTNAQETERSCMLQEEPSGFVLTLQDKTYRYKSGLFQMEFLRTDPIPGYHTPYNTFHIYEATFDNIVLQNDEGETLTLRANYEQRLNRMSVP